jgi:hypothetical protein
MFLDTPAIRVPRGGTPVLIFEHYVATERQYDGGNLKISVNDGPFEDIPEDAFRFNGYNLTLIAQVGGNTNPLGGQRAFSGTDFGTSRGSWGQSQIDLEGLVLPGDEVRFRFAFGTDGCNGVEGWAIDRVEVRSVDTAPRRPSRRVAP